jgi:hypothetical protein
VALIELRLARWYWSQCKMNAAEKREVVHVFT